MHLLIIHINNVFVKLNSKQQYVEVIVNNNGGRIYPLFETNSNL